MVSTSELSGDWIDPNNITDGEKVKILDEAAVVETDWGKQLQCSLEYKGEKKKFGFNKTNLAIMEEFVGTETKDWIGKEILLYQNPTQVKGKPVMGVRIGVPKETVQAKPEPVDNDPNPAGPTSSEDETPADRCARGDHLPTTLTSGIKVCGHCAEKL